MLCLMLSTSFQKNHWLIEPCSKAIVRIDEKNITLRCESLLCKKLQSMNLALLSPDEFEDGERVIKSLIIFYNGESVVTCQLKQL